MKKAKGSGNKGRRTGIAGFFASSFLRFVLLIILFSALLSGGVIAYLIRSGAFDGPAAESSAETTSETTGETAAASYVDPYADESNIDEQTYYLGNGSEKIKFWSYTIEEADMIKQYILQHPEFGNKYTVEYKVIQMTNDGYTRAISKALSEGGENAPDIYTAEEEFVLSCTKGSLSKYAASYYDLGIDVDRKIKEADIVKYITEIGSRNGDIVALGYQSAGCAMIYNAEIAREVFGTDDPDMIESITGANTGKWDKFLEAAIMLKNKGYAAVSGPDDIWNICSRAADTPWIVDGKLNIDPKRSEYLSIAKKLKDNDLTNNTLQWSESWNMDMREEGRRKVFAFFGPAWFLNYNMRFTGGVRPGDGSFGKWRVCNPPQVSFWGGSWILANKDTKHKEAVAGIIEWMTLDISEKGLQYQLANGLIMTENGTGMPVMDTVASATVMARANGTLEFCGGQNVYPVFIAVNQAATSKSMTEYDKIINLYYIDAVNSYADGKLDRAGAVNAFRTKVQKNLNI